MINQDFSLFTREKNKGKREEIILTAFKKLTSDVLFEMQPLIDMEEVKFRTSKNHVDKYFQYYYINAKGEQILIDMSKPIDIPNDVIDFSIAIVAEVSYIRSPLGNYVKPACSFLSKFGYFLEKLNMELKISAYYSINRMPLPDVESTRNMSMYAYYVLFPFNIAL